MVRIKNNLKSADPNGAEEHQLNTFEFAFVKNMNNALISSIYRERLVSTLLVYIARTRFGYSDDQELQFEIDLDQDDRILKVTKVSVSDTKKPGN